MGRVTNTILVLTAFPVSKKRYTTGILARHILAGTPEAFDHLNCGNLQAQQRFGGIETPG